MLKPYARLREELLLRKAGLRPVIRVEQPTMRKCIHAERFLFHDGLQWRCRECRALRYRASRVGTR